MQQENLFGGVSKLDVKMVVISEECVLKGLLNCRIIVVYTIWKPGVSFQYGSEFVNGIQKERHIPAIFFQKFF